MPTYRTHKVIEIARGLKAFFDLNVGLVRGAVPGLEQAQSRAEQLRQRLEQTRKRFRREQEQAQEQLVGKNRQLEQLRQRLEQAREQLADKEHQLEQMPKQLAVAPDADATGARQPTEREEEAGETIVGDPRDHYIGRVVKGKTFADVGGLYGTVSEKVSVAHSYGAAALAMIDIVPEGNELWQAFSERMRYFGISEFDTISDSILDLANSPEPPRYDVVHCTGVLYHMPDPVRFLSALHRITRKHLVLDSAVTATKISGNGETLEVPSSASLFVPALRERERAILEGYWRPFVGDDALGLTHEEISWRADDFAPWWWLPTVESMKAMCASAGFDFEAGAYYWNDNAYVLLLSRRPQD